MTSISRAKRPTIPSSVWPRVAITAANLIGAALAATLVLGPWSDATPIRGWLVTACAFVYVGRLLVTVYVTVQRPITLVEGTLVGSWMLVIQVTMGFLASLISAPVGPWTLTGVILYALGSWLNTAAELQRLRWKKRPRNAGHLYTRGLFRLCRHPNYLGDTVLFVGFALITGSPIALVIPAIMAVGFVFAAIPALDRRLAEHYGREFDAWAPRTHRYIPFIY